MVRLAALPVVDFNFVTELQTRTSDEDNQGILNHAVYTTLMEEARLRYLKACDTDALPLIQHSCNIRYQSPGEGNCTCTVSVRTLHLGKTSLMQCYRIQGPDGVVWVDCVQTLCTYPSVPDSHVHFVLGSAPPGTKSSPLPARFRKRIADFEGDLDSIQPMRLSPQLNAITEVTPCKGPFRFHLPACTRWVDEDNAGVLKAQIFWSLMEEGRLYYFSKKEGLDLMPPSNSFPFVLHSSNMRYHRPGKGGKAVIVDVRTLDLGSSSFSQHYRVRQSDDGQILCEATQVFVMWDVANKRKLKMPTRFRDAIREFEGIQQPDIAAQVQVDRKSDEFLTVGDSAQLTKSFSQADVDGFAKLSEDRNPLHLSADFAASTRFKQQIVHGALTSSLFSGLLGLHLPGPGTIFLSESKSFKRPLFLDQAVTARVTVKHIRTDKPIVKFVEECVDHAGKVVVVGEAVVMVPRSLIKGSKL